MAERSELVAALRALVQATGHESAGLNRCAFLMPGCSCGKIEEQRIALAEANRILREGASWDKRHKRDRLRSLAIAGALIAAEIDQLERLK